MSARRASRTSDKTNDVRLTVNNLVWCKLKKIPHWPCIVTSDKEGPQRFEVTFLNDKGAIEDVRVKDLFYWMDERREAWEKAGRQKHTMPNFPGAVEEAQKHLKQYPKIALDYYLGADKGSPPQSKAKKPARRSSTQDPAPMRRSRSTPRSGSGSAQTNETEPRRQSHSRSGSSPASEAVKDKNSHQRGQTSTPALDRKHSSSRATSAGSGLRRRSSTRLQDRNGNSDSDSDSDGDLPDVLTTASNSKGFPKGSIVWASLNGRTNFWPAKVKEDSTSNRAMVRFYNYKKGTQAATFLIDCKSEKIRKAIELATVALRARQRREKAEDDMDRLLNRKGDVLSSSSEASESEATSMPPQKRSKRPSTTAPHQQDGRRAHRVRARSRVVETDTQVATVSAVIKRHVRGKKLEQSLAQHMSYGPLATGYKNVDELPHRRRIFCDLVCLPEAIIQAAALHDNVPLSEERPAAMAQVDEPPKRYHIFISYRVQALAELAERLCDKLQQLDIDNEHGLRIRCFLDKQNLNHGASWRQQCTDAVRESCLFVPLYSEATLAKYLDTEEDQSDDTFLYEQALALELRRQGEIVFMPLMVGTVDDQERYTKFSGFGRRFSSALGPSLESGQTLPIKTLFKQAFQAQGIFVNPLELGEKVVQLADDLSRRVWPKFRNRWHDPAVLQPEAPVKCVQCEELYMPSQNTRGSCRYHQYPDWGSVRACCGSTTDPWRKKSQLGCQVGPHQSRHHNEYPYESKVILSQAFWNDVGNRKRMLVLESSDYETPALSVHAKLASATTQTRMTAFKGHLCLWLGYALRDYVAFIGPPELNHAEQTLSNDSGNTLIHRFERENGAYAEAHWVMEEGRVVGMRLVAKSATCEESSGIVLFDWDGKDEIKVREIKDVKDGQLAEYDPIDDVPLSCQPEALLSGGFWRQMLPGPGRGDLQPGLSPCLTLMTSGEMEANPVNIINADVECFNWTVSVINKSSEDNILLSVKTEFAVPGGEMQACQLQGDILTALPINLGSRQATRVTCRLIVPVPVQRGSAMWNRSGLARLHPVLFKLAVTDMHGETATLLHEFRNQVACLPEPRENSNELLRLPIDSGSCLDRSFLTMSVEGEDKLCIHGLSSRLEMTREVQRCLVYKAIRDKTDYFNIDMKLHADVPHQLGIWVDRSLRRCVALTLELQGELATVRAIVPMPFMARSVHEALDPAAPVSKASRQLTSLTLQQSFADWAVRPGADEPEWFSVEKVLQHQPFVAPDWQAYLPLAQRVGLTESQNDAPVGRERTETMPNLTASKASSYARRTNEHYHGTGKQQQGHADNSSRKPPIFNIRGVFVRYPHCNLIVITLMEEVENQADHAARPEPLKVNLKLHPPKVHEANHGEDEDEDRERERIQSITRSLSLSVFSLSSFSLSLLADTRSLGRNLVDGADSFDET
ncbi:uncharacterized protein MONBRDRAFT_33144, partial [Monosiga brevicollis MX1]